MKDFPEIPYELLKEYASEAWNKQKHLSIEETNKLAESFGYSVKLRSEIINKILNK